MALFAVDLSESRLSAAELGATFYRLRREREGLWHVLSRPRDAVAKTWLEKRYGKEVVEVRNDPTWQPPVVAVPPSEGLVERVLQEGPLDTARVWMDATADSYCAPSIVMPHGHVRVIYTLNGESGAMEFQAFEAAP